MNTISSQIISRNLSQRHYDATHSQQTDLAAASIVSGSTSTVSRRRRARPSVVTWTSAANRYNELIRLLTLPAENKEHAAEYEKFTTLQWQWDARHTANDTGMGRKTHNEVGVL